MSQHSSLLHSSTDDLISTQTLNPNVDQAFQRASDIDFSPLITRIGNFNGSADDEQQNILASISFDNTEALLVDICHRLDQKSYNQYAGFLRALLDSRHERWVPSKNLSHDDNPITLSLRTSKTIPLAIEIPRIMIDYCIQRAKQEKKFCFVSPVLCSLHELVELKDLHTNLVLNTLRRLTFIPVENESDIINQAIVAHPLKWFWLFRKLDTRSIYDCQSENPVFRTVQTDGHSNHDSCHFSLSVFATSSELLWEVSMSQTADRTAQQSWLCALGIGPKVKVERHAFNLKMLDNPAMEALVKYKWYGVAAKNSFQHPAY